MNTKILDLSRKMCFFWIVYYIAYNTWFGWNAKPLSIAEVWCDHIRDYWLVLIIALALYLLANLYAEAVKKHDKDQEKKKKKAFRASVDS